MPGLYLLSFIIVCLTKKIVLGYLVLICFSQIYPQFYISRILSTMYSYTNPPPSIPKLLIHGLSNSPPGDLHLLFQFPLIVSGLGLNCQPGFFTLLLRDSLAFSLFFFLDPKSSSFLIYFLVCWNTLSSGF